MSRLTGITDPGFAEAIASGWVLVDFWAPWCGPCKALSPTLEAAAEELDGRVRILKMDIDANPETPTGLGIMSIPALVLFKDGKPVARMGNPGNLAGLRAFLAPALG